MIKAPRRQQIQVPSLAELQTLVRGEVSDRRADRLTHSTDASLYQELPLGVVCPRDRGDLLEIVKWSIRHKTGLILRGGGTSLAGQVVGDGLVVDIGRHLNAVSDIDPEQRRVVLEPGVILDDLNDRLAVHGLHFGPDTSTSNRCMIGGMIGNNSCGEHSIIHGTTRDHCLKLEVLLGDGSRATFEPLGAQALEGKRRLDNLEGNIYRHLCDTIDRNRDTILKNYPDPDVIRRNMGYPLDVLAQCRPWNPDGPEFNLAPFICGSEGTLCLVESATLGLVDVPRARVLLCAHFNSVIEACRANILAVECGPSASELIDGTILDATAKNLEQSRNRFWLQGRPAAVLIIELSGETQPEAEAKAEELRARFQAASLGYATTSVRGADITRVWSLRKAGLGLLMGIPGEKKAVQLIEDAAVPVRHLPEYVEGVDRILAQWGVGCVYYAHASVGLLHLRPELNLKDPKDVEIFKRIGDEVSSLVKSYGGSFSGEHGDGRLRSPFIKKMLGEEVYAMLASIKHVFDPHRIFNPGKIIDAPALTTALRASMAPAALNIQTYFDWSADHGLLGATEKCNGAGACRKSPGRGTLCPSYQATRDEKHCTRGRSNLFRQLLSADNPAACFGDEDLHETLALCLSCKACKSECPANVDMARLKAEFLQQYYDRHGVPRRARAFANFSAQARLARFAPGLASAIANTGLFKRWLGVHPRRSMPTFAGASFSEWVRRQGPRSSASAADVALYVDEFTDHLEPHIAEEALRILERCGKKVEIVTGVDSCRAPISKGLLREAKLRLEPGIRRLHEIASRGLPIVGLEPSAALGFRDEIPDLFPNSPLQDMARTVAAKLQLFEEYFLTLESIPFSNQAAGKLLVHGHCHAKALIGMVPLLAALKRLPGAEVIDLNTGCCGMAGSFGYEKEHYDISMAIADSSLFPALRAHPEASRIVAHGTSCRHQIRDGLGRFAQHPVEVIGALLAPA